MATGIKLGLVYFEDTTSPTSKGNAGNDPEKQGKLIKIYILHDMFFSSRYFIVRVFFAVQEFLN